MYITQVSLLLEEIIQDCLAIYVEPICCGACKQLAQLYNISRRLASLWFRWPQGTVQQNARWNSDPRKWFE